MKKIIKRFFTLRLIESCLVFFLGKFPDNMFLKWLRPWCSYYQKGSMRQCLRVGVSYSLDISDYQEWSLYYHSTVDSSFGVMEYLEPGFVVLDVGGNIGQTAMTMGLKVATTGEVYSFEPFPDTYQKFLSNLSLNENILNVNPINSALGAEVTELQMYVKSVFNSGENSLVRSEKSQEGDLVSVPVSTIDTFVQSVSLNKIDFIKIDVEGFEMDVLRGASETLIAHRPSLFIELDDRNLRNQGSSASEVCDCLMGYGYNIREHGQIRPLSPSDYVKHIDIYCWSAEKYE